MENQNRKLPIYLAIGIVVSVTLWMLSGLGSEPAQLEKASASTQAGTNLPQVRIQTMQSKEITREIKVSGRTEPNRMVQIRAEAEGTVKSITAERGNAVADKAKILTLDQRDRQVRLVEAKALTNQRDLEFKAIQNLRDRQFTTELQIAEAQARVESAKAAQQRIELEISYTSITAPFAGVIQERQVEIGDFVRIGDTVAELVDLDPIIITGEVNEREIAHLSVGREGAALLVGGEEVKGTIRYISSIAESATRTFKVELAVPNPDNRIQAGITAQLRLFADSVRVHTMSSALLSLADNGTVGVKVADNNDRVRFYPIEIVGSGLEGLQVSGLPDQVRLITVGQGFVLEGQQVQALNVSVSESTQ